MYSLNFLTNCSQNFIYCHFFTVGKWAVSTGASGGRCVELRVLSLHSL